MSDSNAIIARFLEWQSSQASPTPTLTSTPAPTPIRTPAQVNTQALQLTGYEAATRSYGAGSQARNQQIGRAPAPAPTPPQIKLVTYVYLWERGGPITQIREVVLNPDFPPEFIVQNTRQFVEFDILTPTNVALLERKGYNPTLDEFDGYLLARDVKTANNRDPTAFMVECRPNTPLQEFCDHNLGLVKGFKDRWTLHVIISQHSDTTLTAPVAPAALTAPVAPIAPAAPVAPVVTELYEDRLWSSPPAYSDTENLEIPDLAPEAPTAAPAGRPTRSRRRRRDTPELVSQRTSRRRRF
ncbi:hypothetical protein N7520_004674 [Penicillium odoratum]|uniref:uncharacterized protein n=1 Tax=Penicillium odoratum TaxID=1167516 RepID=UPI002547DBC4|nr:uncharacterized protein N7520_010252 [Penicillium odoratum]XP_056996815.1 uncharacterized protein N7520_004674 [Penicillium odoratum]KAJ5745070.1 hypothetical protein N7520_010252 [Penicillium odoratum]KAJ5765115.1 hypothetical protein N7520_004674 [Penicillium odoratum]